VDDVGMTGHKLGRRAIESVEGVWTLVSYPAAKVAF
jgi:hypothetical protein